MSLKKSIKPHSEYGVKDKVKPKMDKKAKSRPKIDEDNQNLPCPFCNRDSKLPWNLTTHIGLAYTKYYIECDRCACRGPQSLDKKIAIRSWNKRAKKGVRQ